MDDSRMKLPGPDHPIAIEAHAGRVVVRFAGRTIADTRRAVMLREASYPPVAYVPREDADLSLLERTERSTFCPFKGDCAYYTVRAGDAVAENAVWTYEAPYPAVAEIDGRLAFYPNKVEIVVE